MIQPKCDDEQDGPKRIKAFMPMQTLNYEHFSDLEGGNRGC
jgi:hypothetical protein